MTRRGISGLPQPRAAKVRTVRKQVMLEPAEARAQVAAAKRDGKTWSDWIRWLAAREMEPSSVGMEEFRSVVETIVRARVACVAGWDGFSHGSVDRMISDIVTQVANTLGPRPPGAS